MEVELLVSIDFENVRKIGDDPYTFDIAALIRHIPSVKVIRGKYISLHVSVDSQTEQILREAVKGYCIVDVYTDLDIGTPWKPF
jgi:hypothetical protein